MVVTPLPLLLKHANTGKTSISNRIGTIHSITSIVNTIALALVLKLAKLMLTSRTFQKASEKLHTTQAERLKAVIKSVCCKATNVAKTNPTLNTVLA